MSATSEYNRLVESRIDHVRRLRRARIVAILTLILIVLFYVFLAYELRGQAQESACDASLWQHVYKPQRLTVHEPCVTVTGTLADATRGRRKDGVRKEADGDTHGWLKVDPGFEYLLNVGNLSNEDGNLVFEVVCRYPVKQADAKAACRGYASDVVLPPVGSHVAVTGSWVMDDNHAHWNEIHPVTKIEVIQ